MLSLETNLPHIGSASLHSHVCNNDNGLRFQRLFYVVTSVNSTFPSHLHFSFCGMSAICERLILSFCVRHTLLLFDLCHQKSNYHQLIWLYPLKAPHKATVCQRRLSSTTWLFTLAKIVNTSLFLFAAITPPVALTQRFSTFDVSIH